MGKGRTGELMTRGLQEAAAKLEKKPTPAQEGTPAQEAPVETVRSATDEAPVVAAAPSTAATSTDSDDPIKLKEELGKYRDQIQQIEQARQSAEVARLTQQQRAELNADRTNLDSTEAAFTRKYNQCMTLQQQIAEAESEEDYAAVRELNIRYAEAYDDARVLEINRDRLARDYQAKDKYFQSKYHESREADNQKALEQILKPFGLDTKAVLDKVPESQRNNFLSITDTALKTLVETKDVEIASLKKQLAEVEKKANSEARSKWDGSNPGSVPHPNVSGNSSGSADSLRMKRGNSDRILQKAFETN